MTRKTESNQQNIGYAIFNRRTIITVTTAIVLGSVFALTIAGGSRPAQNSSIKGEDTTMNITEAQQIEEIITNSYIKGIHGDRNEDQIRQGFHRDFRMLVKSEGELNKVSVAEWLVLLEKMVDSDPELWQSETTYSFEMTDHTGTAAAVKIEVYKGKRHFSTDYMLLYNFGGKWEIVSKIFYAHG